MIPPLIVLIALIAAWQLYVAVAHPGNDVLPSPVQVARSGWNDRSDLLANTVPTAWATVLGFMLATVLAFAISILVDRWRVARGAVMPMLIVSQTLPIVVLAPLVVIWFGFGLAPKLLLVVLVTFFPVTVALVEGYGTTNPDSAALFRSIGVGWWRTWWSLRLPSAMPGFFTGLRIAITYAVVFAEYAGSEKGLGIYMQVAKNSFRTDLVLAAVAVTSLLTLVLFLLTHALERAVMPWRSAGGDRWDESR